MANARTGECRACQRDTLMASSTGAWTEQRGARVRSVGLILAAGLVSAVVCACGSHQQSNTMRLGFRPAAAPQSASAIQNLVGQHARDCRFSNPTTGVDPDGANELDLNIACGSNNSTGQVAEVSRGVPPLENRDQCIVGSGMPAQCDYRSGRVGVSVNATTLNEARGRLQAIATAVSSASASGSSGTQQASDSASSSGSSTAATGQASDSAGDSVNATLQVGPAVPADSLPYTPVAGCASELASQGSTLARSAAIPVTATITLTSTSAVPATLNLGAHLVAVESNGILAGTTVINPVNPQLTLNSQTLWATSYSDSGPQCTGPTESNDWGKVTWNLAPGQAQTWDSWLVVPEVITPIRRRCTTRPTR